LVSERDFDWDRDRDEDEGGDWESACKELKIVTYCKAGTRLESPVATAAGLDLANQEQSRYDVCGGPDHPVRAGGSGEGHSQL